MKKQLLALSFALNLNLFAVNSEAGIENWQLPAQTRLSLMQNEIAASKYTELPSDASGLKGLMRILFGKVPRVTSVPFLQETFVINPEDARDLMPKGREREIHNYGVTTTFKMSESAEHPGVFSGILGAETSIGIIRFSVARQDLVTPGFGIKWLVEGHPSLSLVAMPSLIPQNAQPGLTAEEKKDYFHFSFSNHPTTPEKDKFPNIAGPFIRTQESFDDPHFDRPNRLPLEHLVRMSSQGQSFPKAMGPYEMIFKPAEDLILAVNAAKASASAEERASFDSDVRLLFLKIGDRIKDKKLFNVYLRMAATSGETIFSHSIVATSGFVASSFADKRLWFQHHVPDAVGMQKSCPLNMASPTSTIGNRVRWLGEIVLSMFGVTAFSPEVRGPKPILKDAE